jgi:hypothetical protein
MVVILSCCDDRRKFRAGGPQISSDEMSSGDRKSSSPRLQMENTIKIFYISHI